MVLGPVGSGKSTISVHLAQRFNVPHILVRRLWSWSFLWS